jgi:NAD(P)-dependent dehydrogenase (short-subunit alcohol dehydrogenase family)
LHELLKTGHSVIATSRKPEALQAELDGRYDEETLKRALVVGLDVSKVEEVKAILAKAIDKFGRIDVVVNNAGYAVLGEVEVCPLETAREQFEVLFWGPVHICKEAIRIFREVNPAGDGGHIFNVGSAGGYSAQPSIPYYASAKFALEGFTESLRKEMSPEWNIQATIIEPGGFITEWRSMAAIPPHPAYDTDNSPTKKRRFMMVGDTSVQSIGIPEKAAKAFISLAEKKQDLPLRIQLGSDALALVQHTAMKTISDSEKWESVSHSTNVDGIDSKEYTKNLLTALG